MVQLFAHFKVQNNFVLPHASKTEQNKKSLSDVAQWQATTKKLQFHSLDFSQVRNTDSVLPETPD